MADLLIIAATLLFMYRRQLVFLRFYQQEEYKSGRFIQWLIRMRAFDRRGTCILLAGLSLALIFGHVLGALLTASFLGVAVYLEEDPRITGKVRLKMTQRAKNIFFTSLVGLGLISLSLLLWPFWIWLEAILLIQLVPLFLVGANLCLSPFERSKQNRFLREAKEILAEVSPFVIGITGSYGKTSTKEALARILQVTLGPTFWPPKSYNTPMGITREIRERLVKGYEYAVIEMGAYQRGSIQRLCELTPPHAALITGVGTCHFDRFGSQDNIILAKSELARAVPKEGILVCNGECESARKMAEAYPKDKTFLYGFKEGLDCRISTWSLSLQGTEFTLHWAGKSYQGFTPLHGRAALSNVMGVFTMACALGADPEFVLAAIRSLEPVDNRLQVKKDHNILYIHDGYNSNAAGFASAIEVMQALPGKRRIVMTPGMIELGKIQREENFRVAQLAGRCCDLALVVGKTNREALVDGFKEGGVSPHNIYLCETRHSAFEKLAALRKEEDIILIENDLTDIYETKFRL